MAKKNGKILKKSLRHLHNYLIPHSGNGFKPGLFTMSSVAVIVIALCAIQTCFFFTTFHGGSKGLASVLPGVLENLTNNDRSLNNVPTVQPDALLTKAATEKAQDMATNGYFAHVSPTGKTPWYWLDGVGYKYTYAGENLAINFTDSADVENAWMHSPAHHANIVKSQYTRIGIGVAQGTYQGKPAIFVAQFFATPTTAFAKTLSNITQTTPGATLKTSSTSNSVLGAEIEVLPATHAATIAEEVATSPHHVLIYFLGTLAGIILLLLVIAIVVRVQVQYLEVLVGGLVLLVFILGLLAFNIKILPEGTVGASNQSASAISAFE